MKVGDLLYYYPIEYDPLKPPNDIGVVVASVSGLDGEVYMKTYWLGDRNFSEEPLPGSPYHNEENVGVLSEAR